jgi:microsomal epoxide hydrolase
VKLIPFEISIPDEVLEDLRVRLAQTRWPDEVPNSGWQFGADLTYLRGLVDYWRDEYDWRAQEARMNAFPQFKASLADIDIHFVHQPGAGPDPMPLLLLHGWPSSLWEYNKVVPLLTDPARFGGDPGDSFTLVVPSLPGFPFSFRPNQPRLDAAAMADACVTLMTEVLGYARFAIHAGDVGSTVGARLAAAYPERIVAIHFNSIALGVGDYEPATAEEKTYLEMMGRWRAEEGGYSGIQSTKPQTLAYGLTDSPVGLAAWLVEKWRSWTDCDGDVERALSRDELLTQVMLYWLSGAINASFWPYYSRRHGSWTVNLSNPRIEVPAAFAAFPSEIFLPPRSLVERAFNVQRWTPMERGGHFAALEQPKALTEDMRDFFRSFR